MKHRVIILFFIYFLINGCSGQKSIPTQGKNDLPDTLQSLMIDSIQTSNNVDILSVECKDLFGDFVDFDLSKQAVKHFFETGDTVSESEAITILNKNCKRCYIIGDLVKEDTVFYVIHASGIGFHQKSKSNQNLVYYKNTIQIPPTLYKKIDSNINIIAYQKFCIDSFIWKGWKNNDPEMYADNSTIAQSYTRWKKLNVKGIYRAFNLSRKIIHCEELDVQYDFDHNNYLYGFLIKQNKMYRFEMNGGGVFILYPLGSDLFEKEEIYGCFQPECQNYFTTILEFQENK